MGVASSLGIISGINYEELVSKLIQVERNPITLLEKRRTGIEQKVGALDALAIKLSTLKSSADILNDESLFNTKSVAIASTGGESSLTATASHLAQPGSYTIYVDQLAQAHKIAAQGWADDDSTPILDAAGYPAGGHFSFRIGNSGPVTAVEVTASTTLKELADSINEADAGVRASIIHDGTASSPYRLVLTSTATGASNDIQITDNATQLDFSNKRIEAATADGTNSGTYTGAVTSNTAEYYTGTANRTYIIETMTSGTTGETGTARYRYSTDGGISWNDNGGNGFIFYTGGLTTIGSTDGTNGTGNNENVKVQFTDSGTMSVGDRFRVDVFNPTFSTPKDAVIRVDSLTLIKDSNTITDVIEGVTLQLTGESSTTANRITVSQGDVSGTATYIQDFVTAYNTVIDDLSNAFAYDPDNPTSNPLRGDYTVRGIQSRLKDIVLRTIPGLEDTYASLSQIGIGVDRTGKLSIDNAKLNRVLSRDPLSAMKLFVDYGSPSDNDIVFEGKTIATKPGQYSIYITRPPLQAQFESTETIGPGGILQDEALTFTFTSEATQSVPAVTAFTVNLSAGDTISTVLSTLNSAFASQEVGLSAVNNQGRISIVSSDYGADIKFTVVSDRGAAGQTGVGNTIQSATGTDVAGIINGHGALGKGKYLTAISGFDEGGLRVSTTTATPGGKGFISVSSGIAAQLSTQLKQITDPFAGTIASRNDSLRDVIDDIEKQIETKEERLDDMEESLRKQFVNLEVLLSSLQEQMNALTAQLNGLPQLYMNSGR